jgi:hypothetical protein
MGFTSPQTGDVERLRQEVERKIAEIDRSLTARFSAVSASVDELAGDVLDADSASFVTVSAEAALPNERVLTAGNLVSISDGGAGSTITVAVPSEGVQDLVAALLVAGANVTLTYNDVANTLTIDASAAPTNATYVTLSTHATLTSERVLTGSSSVSVADGGAGAAVTLDLFNDSVVFGKLQNISTNRLLGRDTAGTGDIEELTVGNGLGIGDAAAGRLGLGEWGAFVWYANPTASIDTVPVECTPGDGLVWNGTQLDVDPAFATGRVLYEVDFASLANNTFVNGTETIDGRNWTAANVSNATRTIFDIQNGTGLRWTAPNSAGTVFTTGSQTAAHLYVDLSSFSLWRPEDELIIEIQYTTGTFENGNDAIRFGLWGQANTPRTVATASAIRMELVDRANHSGTQTIRTLHNATTVDGGFDASGTDVVMGRFRNDGSIDAFYGTYSGGFPTTAYLPALRQATTQSAANPMMCQNTRLVLAFICAADASPTTAVTIRRLRLRRPI